MKRIAIFASGGGSNAEAIARHFEASTTAMVALILTNNPQAGAIEKAERRSISVEVLSRPQYDSGKYLAALLEKYAIDFVALAGYLKKIPDSLTRKFDRRMVNIHPALLPAYGGKGMYGINVHRAVKAAGDTQSGPTIHFVNEVYDKGEILLQARISIDPVWQPEDIAREVLKLEHFYYPRLIEFLLSPPQI
ncbi:phosphoribosylglycinamide formyltransferase [bacterium]|nr:phosphoribosylglycinamide formyltransferase [bacterium]